MDKIPDLEYSDLSQIFAINHIFHLVNCKEFNSFLSKNNIKETEDLFEGYRFFIKTILRGLLETLSRSPSLHIESNLTLDRAMNRGIHLEKINSAVVRPIAYFEFTLVEQQLRTAQVPCQPSHKSPTQYSRKHHHECPTGERSQHCHLSANHTAPH